jgi:hypothetical protein
MKELYGCESTAFFVQRQMRRFENIEREEGVQWNQSNKFYIAKMYRRPGFPIGIGTGFSPGIMK